jgi:hypothetical protein
MLKLKSKIISTNKSAKDVFDYLSELSNFENLMPENVRSFHVDNNLVILDIQGIGKLELAVTDSEIPHKIIMVPKNRVPFKFDIQWNIESINEDQSQIQAIINADLNMMMRMMAEKPLNDFINTQIHKLSDKLS